MLYLSYSRWLKTFFKTSKQQGEIFYASNSFVSKIRFQVFSAFLNDSTWLPDSILLHPLAFAHSLSSSLRRWKKKMFLKWVLLDYSERGPGLISPRSLTLVLNESERPLSGPVKAKFKIFKSCKVLQLQKKRQPVILHKEVTCFKFLSAQI